MISERQRREKRERGEARDRGTEELNKEKIEDGEWREGWGEEESWRRRTTSSPVTHSTPS